MRTLLALTATALACVLAHPPAYAPPAPPERQRQQLPLPPGDLLNEYDLPRFFIPGYLGYKKAIQMTQPRQNDLLEREINIINQINLQEIEPISYDEDYSSFNYDEPLIKYLGAQDSPASQQQMDSDQIPDNLTPPLRIVDYQPKKNEIVNHELNKSVQSNSKDPHSNPIDLEKTFAMTPLEEGYYAFYGESDEESATPEDGLEFNGDESTIEPRQTRQNPNLSKTKHLVAEQVDKLRAGFTPEDSEGTAKPYQIHVLETPTADPAESIYGVALLAAISAALTVAIVGFAFGWYTLSMRAKAAEDVDYPAYGVTGPNVDSSGDRKLAQSAHMYHYQHQKQQIIAMERNGMDRNGSVSDPESEEENEEGDYTVYECPGFATTGEMEVKNPLFNEEPTPATPGKCDVKNAQHKE